MEYMNCSMREMLFALLHEMRGVKAFYLIWFPIRWGEAMRVRLEKEALPGEGMYGDISYGKAGAALLRIMREMRRKLAVISLADACQGYPTIRRIVERLTGWDPVCFHYIQAESELAVLIRVTLKDLDAGFDPQELGEIEYSMGEYALGFTSMVEMRDGSVRQLPLLDFTLPAEQRSVNHLLGGSPDHVFAGRFFRPGSQMVGYTSHEHTFYAKVGGIERCARELGVERGYVAMSGASFHMFGGTPLSAADWEDFKKRATECLPFFGDMNGRYGVDPDHLKFQMRWENSTPSGVGVGVSAFRKCGGFALLRIAENIEGEKSAPLVLGRFGEWRGFDARQMSLNL